MKSTYSYVVVIKVHKKVVLLKYYNTFHLVLNQMVYLIQLTASTHWTVIFVCLESMFTAQIALNTRASIFNRRKQKSFEVKVVFYCFAWLVNINVMLVNITKRSFHMLCFSLKANVWQTHHIHNLADIHQLLSQNHQDT